MSDGVADFCVETGGVRAAYKCCVCGSDSNQHDCALVLRAENERLKARNAKLEKVAEAAGQANIALVQQPDYESRTLTAFNILNRALCEFTNLAELDAE